MNEMFYEIDGNLREYDYYEKFENTVVKVIKYFEVLFNKELLCKERLYISNSVRGSGYTPRITPVLSRVLIIVLNISDFRYESQIAFQLSHELMHYVFYCWLGLKRIPSEDEEQYCIAMSLIVINEFYYKELQPNINNIKEDGKAKYMKGIELAEKCEYNATKLKELTQDFMFNK